MEVEGARVLEIRGSSINRSAVALSRPAMTVVLLGEADVPVGGVTVGASGAPIPRGEAQDFILRLEEAEPLPAAGDANPLTLMKRVLLVVQ